MDINGFKKEGHRLKNVTFSSIIVPENSKILINDAEQIKFTEVKSATGFYFVSNSDAVNY